MPTPLGPAGKEETAGIVNYARFPAQDASRGILAKGTARNTEYISILKQLEKDIGKQRLQESPICPGRMT